MATGPSNSFRSSTLRGGDGLTLHTLAWLPEAEPVGLVVIAHGYAEHSARYERLADALSRNGFAVHAIDFAGHGRSAGRRGFVSSFQGLVADLAAFVHRVRAEHPHLRCGLFGHSAGGAVAAALCAKEPDIVDALLLSSPYLGHGEPVGEARLRLVRLLAGVFPRLGVGRVDASRLSRLPAQVQAYLSDPLVFRRKTSAHTVIQLFSGFDVVERAASITVPLLVIHGNEDRIADPGASRLLSQRVSSTDVTFELVAGGYHELLNDLGRERIVERVVDWFQPRLSD
ncbi:MAG: lysophospholipase [Trueperaceae bacterium]